MQYPIAVAIDGSLAEARARTDRERLANVEFQRADIFDLPFEVGSFDDVFVCFVLEHLRRPVGRWPP